MNKTPAAVVAATASAFVLGAVLPIPHSGPVGASTAAATTPWERCTDALVAFHYQAGDLCDTLPPNTDVTLQSWSKYNLANGWKLTWFNDSDGCWNTASTTDTPYVLCWDGRLTRP